VICYIEVPRHVQKGHAGKVEYWLIRTSWFLTGEDEVSVYPLDFTSISMENLNYVFIIWIKPFTYNLKINLISCQPGSWLNLITMQSNMPRHPRGYTLTSSSPVKNQDVRINQYSTFPAWPFWINTVRHWSCNVTYV
jgi:hypothetical protein